MKPQNNHIILKPIYEDHEVTLDSGLVISKEIIDEKDTTGWADIYAVCEGSKYEVGQRVMYSKLLPNPFKLENIEYMAIKESDVIAIL